MSDKTGAWKFEQWLDSQKSAKELADAAYKTAHPDRYFVAFVNIWMPISSAPEHVWPRFINETLLFEQEMMPSVDEVIATANKAWRIAVRVELVNFYEMSAEDFASFLGDESEWGVIDE